MTINNGRPSGTGASENGPQFLTERELAQRWNLSVKFLQKSRYAGTVVPYRKFGSLVRYALDDVLEFEASTRRMSTSDLAAAAPAATSRM